MAVARPDLPMAVFTADEEDIESKVKPDVLPW
jgi:hypothetical protein